MAFSKVRNRIGFTLVELMIVVAVIGILAGIAIPRYMDFLQRSKEGATKGNLGALRSMINIYYADKEFYFPIYLSYNATWPVRLQDHDGFGMVMADDLKAYIDEIPPCTIGPEPSGGIQLTRADVWHQGIEWHADPTPGAPDVGWWYYRSTDTASGGVVNVGRIYVNVNGVNKKGEYYTSW